jgi:hypothetical protein
MLLNHAPFQQLQYLCEQLRHFQRQQMLLHKAHVYPYGIHLHPLLNVMMVTDLLFHQYPVTEVHVNLLHWYDRVITSASTCTDTKSEEAIAV